MNNDLAANTSRVKMNNDFRYNLFYFEKFITSTLLSQAITGQAAQAPVNHTGGPEGATQQFIHHSSSVRELDTQQ